MAKCVICGDETDLYDNGKPICLECEEDLADISSTPADPAEADGRPCPNQSVVES